MSETRAHRGPTFETSIHRLRGRAGIEPRWILSLIRHGVVALRFVVGTRIDPAMLHEEDAASALPMTSNASCEALLCRIDWSANAVGSRDGWPESLRVALGLCLTSRFPIILFWGRELIQFYNEAYVPILGKRHPRAFGQPARECWPEIWHIVGPMLNGVFDTGIATWSQDQLLPLERNGYPEECYFTFSYSPITDASGVAGVFCVVNETTSQVLHEREQREGLKTLGEFRTLADSISHIVYTHRPDGTVDWANARWHDFTRLPAAIATTTAGWQHVMPADDFAATTVMLKHAFERGEPYEAEVRFKPFGQPDSAYRWHLIRAVPVRDADGKIARWAGTGTDIHERRLAEAERERDLRVLSESLPTIVWTATADGAGVYFNAQLHDYSGLSPADAAGDGWLSIVHPDDVAVAVQAWSNSLATGAPYEVTYRLRGRDGAYRWFAASGRPWRDASGTITRWIGTCTDVDDTKRQYDRERRASEAFQEAALPHGLPEIPGVNFSAMYRAGSAEALVGGDWYDAFRLTDGRIVLSVGDVMGSGLGAAVTMSSVRQAIRGAVQIYPDPCAVLDAADRALRSERPDAIVTAFLGIFDPVTSTLAYASAGHPAPFLRDESGRIQELGGSGLPLGLRPEQRSESPALIAIPAHATLVLYTDGLTEATRDIEEGEERLRQAMRSDAVRASSDPARVIAGATLSELHDDVAILVVRFDNVRRSLARTEDAPTANRWSFDVRDVDAARSAHDELVAALKRRGVKENDIAIAELLFSELVGNVLRHSGGVVEILLDVSGEAPVLHVLDHGPGFYYSARLPANPMSESGRGLYIASKLARDLSISPRSEGGSHARLVLPFSLGTLTPA